MKIVLARDAAGVVRRVELVLDYAVDKGERVVIPNVNAVQVTDTFGRRPVVGLEIATFDELVLVQETLE